MWHYVSCHFFMQKLDFVSFQIKFWGKKMISNQVSGHLLDFASTQIKFSESKYAKRETQIKIGGRGNQI